MFLAGRRNQQEEDLLLEQLPLPQPLYEELDFKRVYEHPRCNATFLEDLTLSRGTLVRSLGGRCHMPQAAEAARQLLLGVESHLARWTQFLQLLDRDRLGLVFPLIPRFGWRVDGGLTYVHTCVRFESVLLAYLLAALRYNMGLRCLSGGSPVDKQARLAGEEHLLAAFRILRDGCLAQLRLWTTRWSSVELAGRRSDLLPVQCTEEGCLVLMNLCLLRLQLHRLRWQALAPTPSVPLEGFPSPEDRAQESLWSLCTATVAHEELCALEVSWRGAVGLCAEEACALLALHGTALLTARSAEYRGETSWAGGASADPFTRPLPFETTQEECYLVCRLALARLRRLGVRPSAAATAEAAGPKVDSSEALSGIEAARSLRNLEAQEKAGGGGAGIFNRVLGVVGQGLVSLSLKVSLSGGAAAWQGLGSAERSLWRRRLQPYADALQREFLRLEASLEIGGSAGGGGIGRRAAGHHQRKNALLTRAELYSEQEAMVETLDEGWLLIFPWHRFGRGSGHCVVQCRPRLAARANARFDPSFAPAQGQTQQQATFTKL